MFAKFRRSFELLSTSWQFLMENKALMVFPIMSIVVLGAVLATFVLKVVPPHVRELMDDLNSHYGWTFLTYLIGYCVLNFFNTAFLCVVLRRMAGRRASIADGLRFALSRWSDLLVYSTIQASIGTVMVILEKRLGWVGSLIANFIGVTWNVASYLAIPALVAEGLGAIAATKRSAQLVAKCWGEGLIGNIGIAAIYNFGMVIVIVIAVAFALLTQYFLGAVLLLLLGCYSLLTVSATMEAIYLASLYRYATKGDARPFAEDALTDAFVPS